MATEDDDSKGLVSNEEIPESTYFHAEESFQRESAGKELFNYGAVTRKERDHQQFILAVFVVTFDTRKG